MTEELTYESALRALLSPLHQATTKEAIAKSSARRTKTVADMREYMRRSRIQIDPKIKVVHITGTKGKGSTACFCEAILRRRYGLRTGLFTSPHLVSIQERIRVNGRPISPESFGNAYWTVRKRLEESKVEGDLPELPGYFRMLTLVGLQTFANYRPSIDVIILEVGMGGRYDATNILDTSIYRTASGVTQLDLDHVRVLGNTVEQIAWEKGGIFAVEKLSSVQSPRPDEAVGDKCSVSSQQEPAPTREYWTLDSNTPSSIAVLSQCAQIEGRGGKLRLVGKKSQRRLPENCRLGLPGEHQYANAELAVALCQSLVSGDGLSHPDGGEDKMMQALEQATWPGRCQTLTFGNTITLRIDGAHTPESLRVGFDWFRTNASSEATKILVFNCHHERNPVHILETLNSSIFSVAYFVRPDSERPSAVAKGAAQDLLGLAGRSVHTDLLPTTGKGENETWQETLESLWKHQRRECGKDAKCVSGLRCTQVLHELGMPTEQLEVFVCGSLYLAGSMLEASGWSETCAEGSVEIG